MIPDLDQIKRRVKEAKEASGDTPEPVPEPTPEAFVPKVFSLACLYRGKIIQDAYKKYEAIAEETWDLLPVYNSAKLDAAKGYVDVASFCEDAETRFKAYCFCVMYNVMTDEGESTDIARVKFRIFTIKYRIEEEEGYEPAELTADDKTELRHLLEDDDYFNEQFTYYTEELNQRKEALKHEPNK
ncbi:hypothetical protein [Salibacterium halotolerans]|uniref:Uncharacterized protein n=1 Tax=Salibacterium halotolerans TaxID=1884432 RepID=A0A1I5UUP1_9BACI|nr:hypothetical protein [Salibacterium halotolerans]SFP98981.1 hypothetical protein SAMN05518683_11464 [Salibacterium halotolerans]